MTSPCIKAFIGLLCKLVALPEYVLTGFPIRENFQQWREKACIAADGPEIEALCAIPQKNDAHLVLSAYERDARRQTGMQNLVARQ